MTGQACDMQAIHDLGQRFGFKIVEDASHAIGGKYLEKFIGNCQFSDITVFSFHPVKIITTAEGGIALTNDDNLAMKLDLFRSHGITRDPGRMTIETDGPWYYQQIELGYNYRMTDIQAALGTSQMTRLKDYIQRRHEIARLYDTAFKVLPVDLPYQTKDSHSSYHLYVLRLKLEEITPLTKLDIFNKLCASGIIINVHYIPIHIQPFYKKLGFKFGDFPNAEAYYKEAISIPIHPNLTEIDQHFVINSLFEILEK